MKNSIIGFMAVAFIFAGVNFAKAENTKHYNELSLSQQAQYNKLADDYATKQTQSSKEFQDKVKDTLHKNVYGSIK